MKIGIMKKNKILQSAETRTVDLILHSVQNYWAQEKSSYLCGINVRNVRLIEIVDYIQHYFPPTRIFAS